MAFQRAGDAGDLLPRHHFDLYHGTTRDHLDDITMQGLQPTLGPFVRTVHSEWVDSYHARYGKDLARFAVTFFAHRDNIAAALTAMEYHIAVRKGSRWAQVTATDVRRHGLLLAVESAAGFYTYEDSDDTIRLLDGDDDPARFALPFRQWYDDTQIVEYGHEYLGLEGGDIFATEPVLPDAALFGNELVTFIRVYAPHFL